MTTALAVLAASAGVAALVGLGVAAGRAQIRDGAAPASRDDPQRARIREEHADLAARMLLGDLTGRRGRGRGDAPRD